MFISVDISEGLSLVILLIHTFAANSTTAIIFLILIQLEDIISSFDATVISAFTIFSWSLFFQFRIIFIYWFDWLLIMQPSFFWRSKESWSIKTSLYFTQVLTGKSTGCIISRIVTCWYILPLLDICVVSDKLHTISENLRDSLLM